MARRFYEKVSIEEVAEGHIIRLDTHKLMTPEKKTALTAICATGRSRGG